MEQIKKIRGVSLKRSFIYAMFFTVCTVVLLSFLTIWGCVALQRIIMPNSGDVTLNVTTTYKDGSRRENSKQMKFGDHEEMLQLLPDSDNTNTAEQNGVTKYTVNKIESSYTALSMKRQAAYSILSVAIIALPAIYSLVGIILCAIWFYRKKLANPIQILFAATENIAAQTLDFSVHYDSSDEMGRLCDSFELMRKTLYENNQVLWNMLDERRMLQASVAHDLRNPIAIIEGYVEYLQHNIPFGNVTEDKLMHTLSNLSKAAKRLEQYTDSIRDIHNLEDLEIHRTKCILPDLLLEMTDDFTVMAKQAQLVLEIANFVPKHEAIIDKQIIYRILENIITNSIRFAQSTIQIVFTLEASVLVIHIQDDGNGFPLKILRKKDLYTPQADPSSQHMGMGLIISRILCKKHGGDLILSNAPGGGAIVEIKVTF